MQTTNKHVKLPSMQIVNSISVLFGYWVQDLRIMPNFSNSIFQLYHHFCLVKEIVYFPFEPASDKCAPSLRSAWASAQYDQIVCYVLDLPADDSHEIAFLIGRIVRKPVFGVPDWASLKPACSVSGTS